MMKDLKNFLKGDLLAVHLAVNIFIATTVLWLLLRLVADSDAIWAISAMIPALDPHMKLAVTSFRPHFKRASRLRHWTFSCSSAERVSGSFRSHCRQPSCSPSYIVRIRAMWRQVPITAAIIIAAGLTHHSKLSGVKIGLGRVGDVLLGCVMGSLVTWLMSKIWPLPEAGNEKESTKPSSP